MKKYIKPKKYKYLLFSLALAILLAAILLFWLYRGGLTAQKIKFFARLPLPAAVVNFQPIYMSNVIFRYQLSRALSPELSETQSRSLALQAAIFDKEVEILSQKHAVSVETSEINSEYERSFTANLIENINPNQYLNSLGMTPELYKNTIIRPQILKTNLNIWFNSQKNLNAQAYAQAENLLKQIQSGADMAELAKIYSQNETEKNIGGDLGFLDPADLLPEIRETVSEMNTGDIKILSTRSGLSLVKVEAKNANLVHLREIYLGNGNFDSWLKSEGQNFKIHKFVSF